MRSSGPYAVLLRKDVKLEVPAVAGVLADALRMTIFDARRIVRYARGIMLDAVDKATADQVVAAMARIGIDTLVAEEKDFAVLSRPLRVVIAECAETAFKLKTDFRRDWTVVPWEQVEFVSAGIIATAEYRDFLSSKSFKLLPPIYKIEDEEAKKELREKLANQALKRQKIQGGTEIRRKNKLKQEDLEVLKGDHTDGIVDIMVAPNHEHFRISRHEFRFDYLGARAKARSLDNFKLLVQDLVTYAREALVSSITMAFLDGMEIHELVFDSPKEFDKYNTWFLYMGRAPASALRSAGTVGAEGGAPAAAGAAPSGVEAPPAAPAAAVTSASPAPPGAPTPAAPAAAGAAAAAPTTPAAPADAAPAATEPPPPAGPAPAAGQ